MLSQYDYSKSLFEFTAIRKHFITDAKYYATLLPNLLLLSTKKHDQNPKYIIPLQLTTTIGWVLDTHNNQKTFKLKAFTIKYFENYKEFHSDPQILEKLKLLLRNRVTFCKISDFYEARYQLGSGSSAKVIQIRNLLTNSLNFAAKAIDKKYLSKGEYGMNAFYSEVEILHQISKFDNVPFLRLYETYAGENTYYLILDLMKGRTLTEEIELQQEKGELFSSKIVRKIMKQLLTAVKILHENNIIHRDLKPDNLMFKELDNFDTLTIVDFGLATRTDVAKYAFPKCGTPGYVAPEILNLQDRNLKYDKVCDVFSCGCIFYKLLTGYSLFMGSTFNEMLKVNRQCQLNFEQSDIGDISRNAFDLLKALLQKNPGDRITAEQALEHNYFNKQSLSPIKVQKFKTESYIKSLKLIKNNNIFKPTQQDSSEILSPFMKNTKMVDKDNESHEELSEKKNEKIEIRLMPSVKKPSFIRSPIDSTFGSFYAKDPLSSYKKLQTVNNLNKTTYDQSSKDKDEMQQICLFNKSIVQKD